MPFESRGCLLFPKWGFANLGGSYKKAYTLSGVHEGYPYLGKYPDMCREVRCFSSMLRTWGRTDQKLSPKATHQPEA